MAPPRFTASTERFDVVVVGGGINGAGVARDAARRGLRVALVEQHDFGSGASSKTSKLIHGGLRYLEHGDLRLVWEACRERRLLLRLAPHLVRPLSFVFPVFQNSRIGAWRLRAGMWLYDLLAAFQNVRRHRMLAIAEHNTWGLRQDDLRSAALYYDAQMDDARLTLLNVVDACAHGAQAWNYARVDRWIDDDDRVQAIEVHDQIRGESTRLESESFVVCAGAWSNALLAPLTGAESHVQPTRGTHIVVRAFTRQAFTLAAESDGRVFFVLPWEDHNLIGTTDIVSSENPSSVVPSDAEVAYLLDEANRFFPAIGLTRRDVVSAFAGLRPLVANSGAASARTREHEILAPRRNVLCVIGGKYTTYRAVAEQVTDMLTQRIGRGGACTTRRAPLPGGDLNWSAREQWDEKGGFAQQLDAWTAQMRAPREMLRSLLSRHGTRAGRIVELACQEPDLAQPLTPDSNYCAAEVVFCIREEMAQHLDDWYLRRTRAGYRTAQSRADSTAVAELFARELGWSAEQRRAELQRLLEVLDDVALSAPRASSRSA